MHMCNHCVNIDRSEVKWKRPKSHMAVQLADAAEKLKEAIPALLEKQNSAIIAMAELVKTTGSEP